MCSFHFLGVYKLNSKRIDPDTFSTGKISDPGKYDAPTLLFGMDLNKHFLGVLAKDGKYSNYIVCIIITLNF